MWKCFWHSLRICPFPAEQSAGNDLLGPTSSSFLNHGWRPGVSVFLHGERGMKAKTRRRIEAGRRSLEFSLAHPDPSPGYATTLTSLQGLLARAEQLITLQRDRIGQVRGATVQKQNLRRRIRRAQMKHLAKVAQGAARENPELAQKFVLR